MGLQGEAPLGMRLAIVYGLAYIELSLLRVIRHINGLEAEYLGIESGPSIGVIGTGTKEQFELLALGYNHAARLG